MEKKNAEGEIKNRKRNMTDNFLKAQEKRSKRTRRTRYLVSN